ncbi:MAG: hypothetical protein ACI3Y0_03880 [Prevotella sp.]
MKLQVPAGKMAIDLAKLKRKELAEKIKNGQRIEIGQSGNAMGEEQTKIVAKEGKLAIDLAKLKRKELAEKIKNGQQIELGQSGNAMGEEQTKIVAKKGKLAAQWYETDKELLEDEIAAMNEVFPQFKLQKIDDPSSRWHKCLAWIGVLRPGIVDDIAWQVMAVYSPNHPVAQMGGSVCVYLLDPTVEDVTAALGQRPFHLINDGEGGYYLCTARRSDISDGNNYGDHVTSAVNTLTWACKWLMAVELVCTGDMTMEEFDAD